MAVVNIFNAKSYVTFVACVVPYHLLSLFCRLAQRIVRGDVPEPLMNRKVELLFSLLTLLQNDSII